MRRGLERLLAAAAAMLALWLIAVTAVAIAGRLMYPFELEWMEGATVVHVLRVAAGESLYVEPDLDFVPFGYPPLYYYVAAAWTSITGPGFLPLRVVSIGGTLLTMVALVLIVRPVSGRLGALVAAGAFAGAYPLTDGWFDLGRVDALYVALLAVATTVAVRARKPVHWAAAGAVAAAAFATKQPAIIVFAPLGAYLLAVDRRAAAWFGGTFGLLSAAVVAAHWTASDGWYPYYVFQLPRLRMAVSSGSGRLLSFWSADLFPYAIALVAGLVMTIRARAWRHLAVFAGLVLSSWISRLEGGAWHNVVMPAYFGLSMLLGLSLRPAGSTQALRAGLAALQLLVLSYDPRPFIPTTADRVMGEAFLQRLREQPGPVLVFDHGYVSAMAGRSEFAHGWAVTDVVWADESETGEELEAEIRDAIRQRRFGAIVLDDEGSWFYRDFEEYYGRVDEIQAPLPPSGAPRRPRYLYTPR